MTYQQLQQKITNVLDAVLERIATGAACKKEINGSHQLTKVTKPIKTNNNKGNKQQLNKN